MNVRDHDLHFTNSLSREKEKFVPLLPGHVGIYVCGPTVYSDSHLGHAKSYVSFDVLVRYLRHLGYKVRYVQNITDVGHLVDNDEEGEDKLQKRALLEQIHPMELAETYTRAYLRDMEDLKIIHADIYPRATQHVPEQIEIIEELIARGHAYVAGENVYFSVASWPDYGKLSGRLQDDGQTGTRVGPRSDKRDARDFALWKSAEGGHILRWKSPWGWGYPGWHIECSAMASKYLGAQFDIHGGGLENQFPHHECEIAQSNAAGMPFARYWLHNNMINVDGTKMSKSLNNYVSVRDALDAHAPEVIRYFVLSTHYRSPANYTREALDAGKVGIERLANCRNAIQERLASAPATADGDERLLDATQTADTRFHAEMDDDLNTPGAIASLFDFTRQVNGLLADGTALSKSALHGAFAIFEELGEGVLGICGGSAVSASTHDDIAPYVELLLAVRDDLKNAKNFSMADRIRDGLSDHGIEIKDAKEGSRWERK